MTRRGVLPGLAVRSIVLCSTAFILVALAPIALSIAEVFFTHAGVDIINKGNWMGKVTWLIASAWIIIIEITFLPSLYAAVRERRWEEFFSELGVCAVLLGFPFLTVGLTYFVLGSAVTTRLALLISAVVVGPCAFLLVKDWLPSQQAGRDGNILRGLRETTLEEVQSLSSKTEIGCPYFGGVYLPKSQDTNHFCFLGVNKSGKTLSMKMLMKSVLSPISLTPDTRALIYDDKPEFVPLLKGMGVPYKILSPSDARGYAWDIATDCNDPGLAEAIATLFIENPEAKNQEGNNNNNYFYQSARDVMKAIIMSHIYRKIEEGKEWDLYDIVQDMRSPDRVEAALQLTGIGRDVRDTYFNGVRSGPDVKATLRSQLNQLETVACSWHNLRQKNGAISLAEWLRDKPENPGKNYALVLGSSSGKYSSTMTKVNQFLLRRIVDLMSDKPEPIDRTKIGRTWFFFDEAIALGNIGNSLEKLLFNLNSKGSTVVLGIQGVSGMNALYGENWVNFTLGQLKNWAIFKCGPKDAQWVSESLFGSRELREYTQTFTRSDQQISVADAEHVVTRPAVMPNDILRLPEPNKERGLTGYYLSPLVDKLWKATLSGALVDSMLPQSDPHEPNAIPVPPEYLEPHYWRHGEKPATSPPEADQESDEQPPASGDDWEPHLSSEDEDEDEDED